MQRRNFLIATGAVLGATALRPTLAAASAGDSADSLLRELVQANDEAVPRYLRRQELGAAHPHRGGVPNEHGIFTAQEGAGFISLLVASLCAPGSKYFQSRELLEPLQLAARFLLRMQHDDGTIDLHSTNFHSTPDLGFVMDVVCPAAFILREANRPEHESLRADLKAFILKAGEALATGGVHTPNHRWVVCAALAWANALYPNPRYVARIDEWLAETIDIDPDGQYTEKSTTVYSPIVNRALITVARLLDRPALLEPVRRNLEMTLYYVHPDGEVVTEASTRQDKYQRGSMARYYYAYRFMALHDGNGRFAAMARQIEERARGKLGELPAFLADPTLQRPLPAVAALPTNYEKVFAYSGLARIRRDEVSATILAGNPTLFSLHKGAAALEALRVASAFFGKGQFTGERLVVQDGAYVLRQSLDGPYFQPVPRERLVRGGAQVAMEANGTLKPISRSERARSNVQTLEAVATIRETQGAFTIALDIRGTEHVPVAIELAFRHGGRLEGVEPVPHIADAYLLRAGTGRYVFEGRTIEFGPGKVEHTWTQLRGALPKWDGQSVYLTGFTPLQTTLTIR